MSVETFHLRLNWLYGFSFALQVFLTHYRAQVIGGTFSAGYTKIVATPRSRCWASEYWTLMCLY